MKEYTFTLVLIGYGDTPEEAFEDMLGAVVENPPVMEEACTSYTEKPVEGYGERRAING